MSTSGTFSTPHLVTGCILENTVLPWTSLTVMTVYLNYSHTLQPVGGGTELVLHSMQMNLLDFEGPNLQVLQENSSSSSVPL